MTSEETSEQDRKPAEHSIKETLSMHALFVGALALLMLFPLHLLNNLVGERGERRDQAVQQFQNAWGGPQAVLGPMLVVPIKNTSEQNGHDSPASAEAIFLFPEDMTIQGVLNPIERHKGLFKIQAYTADLKLSGGFNHRNVEKAVQQMSSVKRTPLWEEARLALFLSSAPAPGTEVSLRWNGRTLQLEDGVFPGSNHWNGLGDKQSYILSAQLGQEFREKAQAAFSLALSLSGSSGLEVHPSAWNTQVEISSSWPHPDFYGNRSPQAYSSGEDGFSASWQVRQGTRHFYTNAQASWTSMPMDDIGTSSFGVRLHDPVDAYRNIDRASKYTILFVGLTFLVYFLLEIHYGRRLHILQYGLVGGSLVVFYLLLLALSEHIGFPTAYAIGAVLIALLIGWYSWGLFERFRTAAFLSGGLLGLYGVLYIILQLVDFALLVGAGVVFVALVLTMSATRNIHKDRTLDPVPDA